jgi:hypothetical protein
MNICFTFIIIIIIIIISISIPYLTVIDTQQDA